MKKVINYFKYTTCSKLMLVSTTLALTTVSLIVSFLFSDAIVQNVDGEFLRIFNPSNTGQADNPDAKINMTIVFRNTTVNNQTIQPNSNVIQSK